MHFIYSRPVDSQTIKVLKTVSGYSHAKLTAGGGFFMDKIDMDPFRQAAILVRQNPHDFQSTLDNLTARILDNTDDPRILKQINELWPNMQGKEVILIAWMLSDTTIGRGLPAVNDLLAAALLAPLADDTEQDDDATDETWQECIRHLIFDMDDGKSKERLCDELNCHEPLVKPSENNTIKASRTEHSYPGEWSKPMPKSMMMAALRIHSIDAFNSFAEQHGIRTINRKLHQIRLDTMNTRDREKIEIS